MTNSIISENATASTLSFIDINSSMFKRLSGKEQELIQYSHIENTDLRYLDTQFTSGNYGYFWVLLTSIINKTSDQVYIKQIESYLEVEKITEAINTPNIGIYLDGIAYFLSHQTIIPSATINHLFSDLINSLFAKSVLNCEKETSDIFDSYCINKSLTQYPNTLIHLLDNKEIKKLVTLINYCTNIGYNNSEILRLCVKHGLFSLELCEKLVSRGCDINSTGSLEKNRDSWNLVHALCINSGQAMKDIFPEFMKKYGQIVNYDARYIHYPYAKQSLTQSYNVIEAITETSDYSILEQLNRLTSILEYSQLTEKIVSQIANYLLTPKMVAKFYDNPVYASLFKNTTFNSELFDKNVILNIILFNDSQSEINAIRKLNKNTVNPTTILLNSFDQHAKQDYAISPFLIWANEQKSSFSRDTANYLCKKYQKEASALTFSNFNKINSSLITFIKDNGITIPDKPSFFSFLGFGQAVQPIVQEVSEPVAPIPFSEHLIFDQALFSKVTDKDILQYISSIELNAEQFVTLVSQDVAYTNEHYIKNLLPKFLNKTVENYLHFATMDEIEAKENVLTQLKLMNKKTFEVLSQSLKDEKDNLARDSRVVGRIIKQA